MFGSLARFALVFAGLAFVIPDTLAHDSWISRGDHRNAAGEWCCGEGDCFVVPKERVMMTGDGYGIIHGPLAGIGPSMYEAVPFSEAQLRPTAGDAPGEGRRRENGALFVSVMGPLMSSLPE